MKTRRTERVTVRIEPALRKAAEAEAESRSIDLADVVREALKKHLAKRMQKAVA